MGGAKSSGTTTNNFSEHQLALQKGFANWALPDGENVRTLPNFSNQDIYDKGLQGTAGLNDYHRAAQNTAWDASQGWQGLQRDALTPLYNSGTNYNQAANSNMYTGVANAPEWSTSSVQHYMAPGSDLVLNPALKGLHSGYVKANTALLGDAASRGALNNDRVGVAQANLGAGYADQVANTVGSHYMGLYDRANQAMQADYDRRIGAQGFNRDTVAGNNQTALNDLSFNRGTVAQNNNTNANLSTNIQNYANNWQKLGSNAANIQAGIGDVDRNAQQQIIDTGYNRLLYGENYPLTIAQAAQGYSNTPTSTTTTQKQGGGVGSFLGPVASVGGALLSSDPKAKTNVKKASAEDALAPFKGKNVYHFDYTKQAQDDLGQPSSRQVGIMFDASDGTGRTGGLITTDLQSQMNKLNAAVAALVKKSEKARA